MNRMIKNQQVFKAYRLLAGKEGFAEIHEVVASSYAMEIIKAYHIGALAFEYNPPSHAKVFDPIEEGYVSERLENLFDHKPTEKQIDDFILDHYSFLIQQEGMDIAKRNIRLVVLKSGLDGANARKEGEKK